MLSLLIVGILKRVGFDIVDVGLHDCSIDLYIVGMLTEISDIWCILMLLETLNYRLVVRDEPMLGRCITECETNQCVELDCRYGDANRGAGSFEHEL